MPVRTSRYREGHAFFAVPFPGSTIVVNRAGHARSTATAQTLVERREWGVACRAFAPKNGDDERASFVLR